MRPASSALVLSGVLSSAAWALPASAGQDAGSFQDVPASHWAYATITDLQRGGLITGYPEGYFLGKRTLTRYEFAIAIKRSLDRITLSTPAESAQDTPGLPQVTSDGLREMRRLVGEFQNDLAQFGETHNDLENCFATLERAVVRFAPPLPIQIKMPSLSLSPTSHSAPFAISGAGTGDPASGETRAGSLLPFASNSQPLIVPSQSLRSLPFLNSDAFDFLSARGVNASGPLLSVPGSSFSLGEAATAPGAGLRLDMPLFRSGQVGFAVGNATVLPSNGAMLRRVTAYGTDLQLHAAGRLTVGAAMTRTLADPGATLGDVLGAVNSDTYRINLGYASGPANAILGWQIVDPLPDNLANLQGPYTRLSYRFANGLQSYLSGDYYSSGGIRGLGSDPTTSSLLAGNIYRGGGGVSWSPARGLSLSADFEGVLYDLSGMLSASGRRTQSIEQYITLGAGLNLTRNAILKLAYQIANQQDNQGSDTSGTAVFTTQFAIHF